MHRLVAISLLFLYTFVWMRPYFPYLEYAINKEYAVLSTDTDKLDVGFTRCEDICYLEDQLDKYDEQKTSNELPTQRAKFGHEVLMHTVLEANGSLESLKTTLQQEGLVAYIQFYDSRLSEVASPPPKHA